MASSQQDVDWQSSKKTVLERSRHMFNNPFMSDVVLCCEGSSKEFRSHKYVLATSSSVFYAMFYGELAEKNSTVYLSDSNDDTLEEFLRFLYTDDCNLTADNAVFVLYLAKKYIVPSLAEKCTEFLEANLATENVFVVLQQALQFDEKKLEKKCWGMIDLKTSEAIVSDAFTDITQSTLAEFLKRESLNVKEVDLFKAVVKWSKAECLRQGKESSTENKRAVMGNAIHQIRFASMTLEEFGQNVSRSGLLTLAEVVLFYDLFSGEKRVSDVWNMSEREPRKEILLRCCRFNNYWIDTTRAIWISFLNIWNNELCISFSKSVKLHGVRLLGDEGRESDVKLEVLSQLIQKRIHAEKNTLGIAGLNVMLPRPVKVKANVIVHLKVTIRGLSGRRLGMDPKKTAETNGITVNFFKMSDITSGRTYSNMSVEKDDFFDEIIFSEV